MSVWETPGRRSRGLAELPGDLVAGADQREQPVNESIEAVWANGAERDEDPQGSVVGHRTDARLP